MMHLAIDKVYPLWRFSLVEKTEQDVATSQQRGHFPLMWLANFAALLVKLILTRLRAVIPVTSGC